MALLKTKTSDIEAFAISRDADAFQMLNEDLERELSGRWMPLAVEDASKTLLGTADSDLEVAIVCVTQTDEHDLEPFLQAIKVARAENVRVMLVAKDVSPTGLHQLMRTGAEDFAPYPLPEGALNESIAKLRSTRVEPQAVEQKTRNRRGIILPVYGVAGGVGASTFAVNMAWELAQLTRKTDKRVALFDFNFQFGSVSTYLDMARREAIYELISDPSAIDHESLGQALTSFKTRLAVLTAPMDALPLDIIAPEDITKLLEIAQSSYDFIVVDMPQALVHWSDDVLRMSETYFAVMEADMRSAQNTLRFLRALKAEELPFEKVQFALNRAPGGFDINGKARVKRLSESLGVEINILLPDGGKAVVQAGDEGLPLEEAASKNALRKEIRNIAKSIFDAVVAEKAAVVQ
ncbi:MAG: AAA family ATPase [Pseudomonadota bacterium]